MSASYHKRRFRALPLSSVLVATPRAVEAIGESGCRAALLRHFDCDHGDLDPHDVRVNEEAYLSGERIMSVFQMPQAENPERTIQIWVITDAGWKDGRHEVTTVLLPSDY
jgi:hypothetical protein